MALDARNARRPTGGRCGPVRPACGCARASASASHSIRSSMYWGRSGDRRPWSRDRPESAAPPACAPSPRCSGNSGNAYPVSAGPTVAEASARAAAASGDSSVSHNHSRCAQQAPAASRRTPQQHNRIFSDFGGLSSEGARVLEQFAVFSRKEAHEFHELLKSMQDVSSNRESCTQLNVNDCANAF